MILRMFRSNQPELGLLYPFAAILFWLPGWWISPSTTPQLSLLWFAENNPLHSGSWANVAAFVGLLVGAFLFNRIFQQHELISRKNQLPGLCYILAFSWAPFLIHHNYLLFALVFVLMAIQQLMQIYRQQNVLAEVFNASILIGVAAIIYVPSVTLVAAIWLSLIVLRSFNAREWFMPIAGFATVASLFFGLDFLFDWHTIAALSAQFNSSIVPGKAAPLNWIKYITIALLVALSLIAAPGFLQALSRSTTRNRNLKLVLLCFGLVMVIAYGVLFLTPQFSPNHTLLGFPLALALVYALADKRINWIISALFYALILSALIGNYSTWLLS